jgi:hypothetical protein
MEILVVVDGSLELMAVLINHGLKSLVDIMKPLVELFMLMEIILQMAMLEGFRL